MTDQHIRVYLAEGDEQQLADLVPDDYVEFAGSINGADIPVRFYRAEVDERSELDERLDEVENIGEIIRIAADLDVGEGATVQSEYTRGVLDFIQELTGFNNSDDDASAKRVLLERINRYKTTN